MLLPISRHGRITKHMLLFFLLQHRAIIARGKLEALLQVVDQQLSDALLQAVGWKLYRKWWTKNIRKLYCVL